MDLVPESPSTRVPGYPVLTPGTRPEPAPSRPAATLQQLPGYPGSATARNGQEFLPGYVYPVLPPGTARNC
eukprot:2940166-Rhodomonas_salina.3